MRIDVRKVLFIGAEQDRFRFFLRAQESGIVEFIDPKGRVKHSLPAEIQRLMAARKVLRRYEPVVQEDLDDLAEADEIARHILELRDRLERMEEEQRILRQEMARVEVFGSFDPEDVRWIERCGERVFQYWFTKKAAELDLDAAGELLWVGSNFGLDYYVSVAPQRREYAGLTEMRVDQPIDRLRLRQQGVVEEERQTTERIKSYEKRNEFLQKRIVDRLNTHSLISANENVQPLFGGHIFAVEGWAPENQWEELERLCVESGICMEQIAVDKGETVPTYLENRGFSRVGEDLVHIYDSPSTEDRDPSLWVLWFFALFFAMIVGDAGYGLILLGTSLWMGRKFRPLHGVGKRFVRLCVILSSAVIVWGVVTTSFFGIEIPLTSPLQDVSVVHWLVEKKADYVIAVGGEEYQSAIAGHPEWAQYQTGNALLEGATVEQGGEMVPLVYNNYSNNVMIELALLLGSLHVILSMLRVIDRNWAGVGWILFIIGAYLWCPSILDTISMANYVLAIPPEAATQYGLQVLLIGIGLAVSLALIQRRLGGISEVTQVVQVFADILSYLRLYALGLAGTIMAETFNMMGGEMGPVFGVIVILIGHAVNIALAIMGGIIHGLRLNFLEWYHWSFEGGGHMLRPLRLLRTK